MKENLLLTVCFTSLALIAFAANSVLTRLALGVGAIDPTSFTILRLLSGTVILWLLLVLSTKPESRKYGGNWLAALMLFIYVATFSFAYMRLDTGVGALVLFGAVQVIMIFVSFYTGERLGAMAWSGLILAFVGFAYLLLPDSLSSKYDNTNDAISLEGFILMAISGIAWGGYTLIGKNSSRPLHDTAHNFLKSIPFTCILTLIFLFQPAFLSMKGILLSIATGAITSGLGYAIWYIALQGLSRLQSGVVQLLVPVIAALGGIIFIGEALTYKLLIAMFLILSGILCVTLSRAYPTSK